MPDVFNAVIATGSRANAMVADMKDADFKDLQPKSIAQNTAIGPKPAIDVKLVYGPECEVIEGYRDTHILQYDKRQIDKTLEELVKLGTTQTYLKSRVLKITESSKLEVEGTREVHISGEDHEDYDVHREIHEPFKFEVSDAKAEFTKFAIDTKGQLIEGTISKVSVEGLIATIELAEYYNTIIKNALHGINEKIHGLEEDFGGFCAKVIATYDALPSPSIIAPVD